MFSNTRIRNSKREAVEEALFPRYISVQFCEEQLLIQKVRSTFDVINSVIFGQNLAQIADADMHLMYNDIQNLTSQIIDNGTHSAPRIGDCVEITQRPFSGLNANIVELSGNDRCLVMLEMLYKQVRADLSYN